MINVITSPCLNPDDRFGDRSLLWVPHSLLFGTLWDSFTPQQGDDLSALPLTLSMSHSENNQHHHYVTVTDACCDKAVASSLMSPDTRQSHARRQPGREVELLHRHTPELTGTHCLTPLHTGEVRSDGQRQLCQLHVI